MNEPLTEALKSLIPVTCLPSEYSNHQELADALTMKLAGTISLVPKIQYDSYVREINLLRCYRRNCEKFHG